MKKTYINGHIFVGDSEDHFANGMIVENGRIKWIGNDPVPEGETIDLQGQTVLPGLIDCHTHPKYIADALHGVACTPPNVNKKHYVSLPPMVRVKMSGSKDGDLTKPN